MSTVSLAVTLTLSWVLLQSYIIFFNFSSLVYFSSVFLYICPVGVVFFKKQLYVT